MVTALASKPSGTHGLLGFFSVVSLRTACKNGGAAYDLLAGSPLQVCGFPGERRPKMKAKYIIAGILLVLLASVFSFGERGRPAIKATIPFDFRVGDAVCPAGEYTFTWDSLSQMTRISGNNTVILIMARQEGIGAPTEEGKLVFLPDQNGQMILHQVWSGEGPLEVIHAASIPDLKQ